MTNKEIIQISKSKPKKISILCTFKGAQAWEFFARVFCSKRTHLGMWLRVWEKNSTFFIKWSLISKVYGFLPHTECVVNKKKILVRPKLKVGGGCLGAHMCAHNVFLLNFYSFVSFMTV